MSESSRQRFVEELRPSAEHFARLALRDHLAAEPASFLLHAGTAMELLAKAFLCSMDPTLVADVADFDAVLHASGHGRHARKPRHLIKTVTTRAALDRCGQIVPPIANLGPDLARLVDARNGTVHLGLVDQDAAGGSLVPFLKVMQELLRESGWDSSQFWGDYEEVVTTRLSESSKDAAIKAMESIAAARVHFRESYDHLPQEVRETVVRAVEASYTPFGYEEQLVDCPACYKLALTSGNTEVQWEADWEADEFGQPYVSGGGPVVTFFPGYLRCRVCDLELDGEDELEAAGLQRSWTLDDVDPSDFYDEESI
jgi:hypothetical protein